MAVIARYVCCTVRRRLPGHPVLHPVQRQAPAQHALRQFGRVLRCIVAIRGVQLHARCVALDPCHRLPQRGEQQNFVVLSAMPPAEIAGKTLRSVAHANAALQLKCFGRHGGPRLPDWRRSASAQQQQAQLASSQLLEFLHDIA